MSGTKAQLEKRYKVYKKMAEKHLTRHLRKDKQGETDGETKVKFEKRQKYLNRQIEKIGSFLEGMEQKKGRGGQEIQSNVTDNESAMIHSSKGFIQGYIGIAVSDQKSQVITSAHAFGSANETEHMGEMLDEHIKNLEEAEVTTEEDTKPTMCGDPNYFSEGNLRACEESGIEAVIADSQAKRRVGPDGKNRFDVDDFTYNETEDCYECPQGKKLEYKRTTKQGGIEGKVYQASLTDCKSCPLFLQCSWSKKEQGKLNQGKALRITATNGEGSLCREMRKKLETVEYQDIYANRIQIVEPVFANIRYCKGLNRFTLRGEEKVNSQWQLYCMVHNLGKCLNGRNAKKNVA